MPVTNSLIAWGVRFSEQSYNLRVDIDGTMETLRFPISPVNLLPTTDYFAGANSTGISTFGMLTYAILTHSLASGVAVSVDSELRTTIQVTGGSIIQIDFSDPLTTMDARLFGFLPGMNASGSGGLVTSTHQASGLWRPGRTTAEDSRERPVLVSGIARTVDGLARVVSIGAARNERDVSWSLVPQEVTLSEYAAAPQQSLEHAWSESIARGHTLRLYDDETQLIAGSYSSYQTRSLEEPSTRSDDYPVRWDVGLELVSA